MQALELALLPSLMLGSEDDSKLPMSMILSHQLRQFSTVVQLSANTSIGE